MRAALRPRYTFAEYLEIERRSREVKHEYVRSIDCPLSVDELYDAAGVC